MHNAPPQLYARTHTLTLGHFSISLLYITSVLLRHCFAEGRCLSKQTWSVIYHWNQYVEDVLKTIVLTYNYVWKAIHTHTGFRRASLAQAHCQSRLVYIHIHTHTNNSCTHAHPYAHTHARTHTHTQTHTCTQTQTHTFTHTNTQHTFSLHQWVRSA